MLLITIALAIALAVLVVKNTKADLKHFLGEFKDCVLELFTKKTALEAKDDFIHAGKTILKAGGQVLRALKLVGFWLGLPVLFLAIVIALPFVFTYKAFTE